MMLYCAGASSHTEVRPPGNAAGNQDSSWRRPSTASMHSLAGQDYPSVTLCAASQPQEEGASNLPQGFYDAVHGQTAAPLRDFAFAPEEVTFLETVLSRRSDDASSNQQIAQYGFINTATAPMAPTFGGHCYERQTLPGFASITMPSQPAQNLPGCTAANANANILLPFGTNTAPISPTGHEPSLRLANTVSAPIAMAANPAILPNNDQPKPQFSVGRYTSAVDQSLRLLRPPPIRISHPQRDSVFQTKAQQFWPTYVPGCISCPSTTNASVSTAALASALPPSPAGAVPWPWTTSQVQSSWLQQQQQQPQQHNYHQQQQLHALPAQHPALHNYPHGLWRSQSQRPPLLPARPPTTTATATDDATLDEALLAEIKAAPWPSTTGLRPCNVNGCICAAADASLGQTTAASMAAPTQSAPPSAPYGAMSAQMQATGPATHASAMVTVSAAMEHPPPLPTLSVPTQPAGIAPISPGTQDLFLWPPNTFPGPMPPMVWEPPPIRDTQAGGNAAAQQYATAASTHPQRLGAPCVLPHLPPATGANGFFSRNANEADLAPAAGSVSGTATQSPTADMGVLQGGWTSSPQQQPAQAKNDAHGQGPQAMDTGLEHAQLNAQPSKPWRGMIRPAGLRPSQPPRVPVPFAALPQPPQPPPALQLHSATSMDRSSADTQTRLEGGTYGGEAHGGGSAAGAGGGETSQASDAGGIIAGTAMAARNGRSRQSLTLEALRAMFELPAQDVVVALAISATDLKRRCRTLGIRRWPHRKLASLKRLAEAIEADDELGPEERQLVLDRVAHNRAKIFADPDAEFDPGLKSLRQVQYKRHFIERQNGGNL